MSATLPNGEPDLSPGALLLSQAPPWHFSKKLQSHLADGNEMWRMIKYQMEMGRGTMDILNMLVIFSLKTIISDVVLVTILNYCGWRIFSLTSSFGARDELLISLFLWMIKETSFWIFAWGSEFACGSVVICCRLQEGLIWLVSLWT